jgi:hypothetical protein
MKTEKCEELTFSEKRTFQEIMEFIRPEITSKSFTTADFESARTRSGVDHEIKVLRFTHEKGYPEKAYGMIRKGLILMNLVWDSKGNAFNQENGLPWPEYDLIRRGSSRVTTESLAVIALFILCLLAALPSF